MPTWFLILSSSKHAPQFHLEHMTSDTVTYYAFTNAVEVAEEYIETFDKKQHMYYREVSEKLIDKLASRFPALEEIMYIDAEMDDDDNGRCKLVCTPEEYSYLLESIDGWDCVNEHGAIYSMERYAKFYKAPESKVLLEALQNFKDMLEDTSKVAKYRKKSWYYETMKDFGLR